VMSIALAMSHNKFHLDLADNSNSPFIIEADLYRFQS
jgi:hypothetical protein